MTMTTRTTSSASAARATKAVGRRERARRIAERYGTLAVAIALLLGFALTSDVFLSPGNIRNILLQVSVVGIAAIGATIVMLAGHLDLSVGGVVLLSEVVIASLSVNAGVPAWAALIVGLLAGGAVGLVSGLLVAVVGIEAILATLATLLLAGGLGLWLLGDTWIQVGDPSFAWLVTTNLFGSLPVVVLLMLVLYAIAAVVMQRTPFGRALYSIGNNPVAARLTGLAVRAVVIVVFIAAGICSALAGFVNVAQLGLVSQNDGAGLEFQAIIAVLIGGLSVTSGGIGRVERTLIGVLIVGMITNYQTIKGVPPTFQQVVLGGLLLVSVLVDRLLRGRSS